MSPEELNKIIIHFVPNAWAEQAYLQGWGFKERTYKNTCEFFECMEILEQVYKGDNNFKNTKREESDHDNYY